MAIAANFPTVRPSLLLDFSNQTVLDPRVTFARTTTALYYDNKSAALAEQNLLTYSNTLTNAAWTAAAVGTPVLNATDPTGTASGAYTVTATVGSAAHYLRQSASAAVASTFAFSCYLQAGTNSFATLTAYSTAQSATWVAATFNLTTGALTQQQAGTVFVIVGTPTITQVGSTSWYRCTIVLTTSGGNLAFYPSVQINSSATPTLGANGLETWTALGTETILAYGAQLEQHTGATVYTATTATAVNTYTPTLQTAAINAPRFDYNPTTRESLGLLLEQAATNLALYSSDYTNAAWTKTACTITAAADISPDGSQNASLLVLTAASAQHFLYSTSFTAVTGGTTASIYLKYYGQQYVTFGVTRGNADNVYALCNFDLINGTFGTAIGGTTITPSIQAVGNGWYRCSVFFTGISQSVGIYVVAANNLTCSNTFSTVVGNGFNGYLVWGAQAEAAPSATSYIATVASAQTRTVDSASMTGTNFTSWYNYSGGTVYVEASGSIADRVPVSFNDNSTANRVSIFYTSTGINTTVLVNNVSLQNSTIQPPGNIVANTFYKTAYYFSTNGTGVSSAGQTATTAATAISAPAINQVNLGSQAGASNFIGRIKKFAYYPLALTNTQIQSLSAN